MSWITFEVQTTRRAQMVNITERVAEAVERSGVDDGTCHVFIPHTTAGVTINEGADPDVAADVESHLAELVPKEAAFDHDADESHEEPRHGQGDDEERGRAPGRGERGDGGDAGVGAEGVERPAGEVEDLLYAEDHLQSGSDQEEDGGVEDAAHEDVDEVLGHGPEIMDCLRSSNY